MPSSKNTKSQDRGRRSRSRATTPISPTTEDSSAPSQTVGESAYLHAPLSGLLVPNAVSIESLIEKHSSDSPNPPSAASLHALHDGITMSVLSHVERRGEICDSSMRQLVRRRKDRLDAERARDEQERADEERRKREVKKIATKKRDREQMESDSRPPAVGAHGLARQDGVDVHEGTPPPTSPAAQLAAASAAAAAAAAAAPTTDADPDAPSPTDSDASQQPPPAPAVARYETFGEDPSTFDDPTIYHIRDVTPAMTDEEKKDIYCVAHYPHDDLHDLIPGTPPDLDFSNAKPPNQINFSTFQAYVEPYIRMLTEEDVAFLKERGDRVTPYLIPPRGPMPYREVWAREDGSSHHDFNLHLPSNEARGSIENMNDDVAETDEVSTGPVLARLLEAFRHDPSNTHNESLNQANGDVSMANGESTAGAQEADVNGSQANGVNDDDTVASFKPATYFPDLSGTLGYRLPANANTDFGSLEQRALQELRYCGFLTPEATPDYDSHFDDEIAARLRYLQAELQLIARENAARKARVLELTEERMAGQEYATIADDLDTQINTAYLKRNRTMGKPKKGVGKARPGQAGTGGVAMSRNMVSEGVRMLMDRRQDWREQIGPVVDYGQNRIPKDTVFDKANMERLEKAEADVGDAEGE